MPKKPVNETPESREKRLARGRAYEARRRAADPEDFRRRQCESARRYAAKNPEKAKAATKKWRMANKPRFNELRRIWRSNNIVHCLVMEAKHRAKARGVEFSITDADVPPMGTHCPLLGTPFPPPDVRNQVTSPSLDRIDSARGYVPGNVWIVGYRANAIKSDGTAEEHEKIAAAMRMRASITHVVVSANEAKS